VAVLITVLLAGALGAIAYRAARWPPPIAHTPQPGEVTPTGVGIATAGPTDTASPGAGPWQPASGLPAHLYAIVVDPSVEMYLVAGGPAADGQVFASEDEGRTWTWTKPDLPKMGVGALAFGSGSRPVLYAYLEDGGLYASGDRGATWKQLGKTGTTCSGCRQRLYVHPADEHLMLAIDGDAPQMSRDGGQTWAKLTDGLGELRANCAALWPEDLALLYLGTPERGVIRSTDGGRTWEPANVGMLDANITALAVDPKRAEIVYAGTADGALFRSVDGGESWAVPGDWPPRGTEAGRIVAIAVNRYSPDEVFVLANGTGLARSRNGGKSWEPLDTPPTDHPAEFVDMALSTFPETAVVAVTAGQGAWRWMDK
jgi:hypothetical protein